MGQTPAALSRLVFRLYHTGCRRVFIDSCFACICHRHDDERLDQFLIDQSLRCFIHPPLDSGKRSGRVENVLPILQIENRMTFSRETRVTLRQPNQNVAPISEDLRWKLPVPPDCSRKCVFGHETETLRMSFRACRGISYYFRMRINLRVRDFSTSPAASLEMTKRK